jgi:membrane-anchored glycerophosphoryl diester phosphodiesterase (GDPDase)
MLVADGIEVLGGACICRYIPDIYIKWLAGIIFILFGTLTIYSSVQEAFLAPVYVIGFLALMVVLIYLLGVKFAYFGQICDISLPKQEISADNDSV